MLLHYLGLADDGALPAAEARSDAAWARLPMPPYCDADGRLRPVPEVVVRTNVVAEPGSPVASRRHAGATPSVKLRPAALEPVKGTRPSAFARRRFYDEAVAFVERLLRQVGDGQ